MKVKLTTATFLLLLATIAYAQEKTVQKIKNAFQSEAFQLSGYGQLQYNISKYPERSLAPGKANNSMDITRAILFATGKLGFKNQWGYMLMYDFGPSSKLIELYGEWLPSKAINIRFGQYKIPFTIENPMSLTRIETINPSRSVSAMSGSSGDFNQYEPDGKIVPKSGRDAGLQLSGQLFPENNFFQLEYYAGFFNGTGMNVKDNNNHKDFLGTLYWYPLKSFKIGGSAYFGKLRQSINDLPVDDYTSNRWTVGAEYKDTHFCGRAEYITANDGNLKRNGYYGLLVWKWIPNKLDIIGKYDFYDKNTQFNNDEVKDITLGVDYYFAYLSRIQLNYIYSDNKAVGINHALAMQLFLFF
jgi:hypothetical protein